jgi:hypothetical protein
MTVAREHRRAVRRIKAKKAGLEKLRTWEWKRLDSDGQSTGAGAKK